MQSFSRFCQKHTPTQLQARRLCQGSTIILIMCVLLGAATAAAVLVARLAPAV